MTGHGWYELIDAGDGRRLERFGERVVDRPAPAVDGQLRGAPDAWSSADATYERDAGAIDSGMWRRRDADLPDAWRVVVSPPGIELELRLAGGGQVGVFPEHVRLSTWAADLARSATQERPIAVLNLFAYTGASTLALAAAGASVTHVDSSRTAITWARRNAELSGLTRAPIRWIVDDAEAFVAREARRGRRYEALIVDPPSFGRAPGGRSWRLEEHLDPLLRSCRLVLAPHPVFTVVTSHTPSLGLDRLGAIVRETLELEPKVEELAFEASLGARLSLGWSARWPA